MNLNENCLNETFSHIYVENNIANNSLVIEILNKYPKAQIVKIKHYKDVFSRSGQDSVIQRKTPKLILAEKKGELIYKGAPVCQNFGNEHFYYTSCVMNCIYDCEYCYLKGMYPSGNLVIFVNIEDIFNELRELLKEHPVYLCVSYDTDLMAIEGLCGYVAKWVNFVNEMRSEGYQLSIEIRTKSANESLLKSLPVTEGVIYAFTMSPQAVTLQFENKTPQLDARINTVKKAMELGHTVRLCFDPMIYCKDWKIEYESMLNKIFEQVDMEMLMDVSVGSFRISQDYLKKMRKQEKDSVIAQFPYVNSEGFYHYPNELLSDMEEFLVTRLIEKIGEDKIFRWK